MTDTNQEPLLILGEKQYKVSDLSDEAKGLVQALQVAESQIAQYQNTVGLLSVSRESLLAQLTTALSDVDEVEQRDS